MRRRCVGEGVFTREGTALILVACAEGMNVGMKEENLLGTTEGKEKGLVEGMFVGNK